MGETLIDWVGGKALDTGFRRYDGWGYEWIYGLAAWRAGVVVFGMDSRFRGNDGMGFGDSRGLTALDTGFRR